MIAQTVKGTRRKDVGWGGKKKPSGPKEKRPQAAGGHSPKHEKSLKIPTCTQDRERHFSYGLARIMRRLVRR